MNRLISFIFLFFVSLNIFGQGKVLLSGKPETFVTEAKTLLTSANNPNALRAVGVMEATWDKLSDPQKQQLASLSKMLLSKSFRAYPHISGLLEGVGNALAVRNLKPEALSQFLEVTTKVIETSTDSKATAKFIETSRTFFSNGLIFNTAYNRLYLLQGKDSAFEFKFNADATSIVPPAPEATKAEKELIEDEGWGNDLNPKTETKTDDGWGAETSTFQTIAAGAIIEFTKANLVVVTASDSATLFATDGTLAIKEGLLTGKFGRFTWEYAGINDAYVMLGAYTINVQRPIIVSQDATLHYEAKIDAPVRGTFEYQSRKRNKGQRNTYPRFFSASNSVKMKNLPDGLNYAGGYSLIGDKTFTTSADGRKGVLSATHEGKVVFRAISRSFAFSDTTIIAPQAAVSMYIEKDSVYHPALKFNYLRKDKFLKLAKTEKGSGWRETAYTDSFHQMEGTVDACYYDIPKGKMDFYMQSGKSFIPAIFESFEFYNPERYNNLVGSFGFHPLQMLYGYLNKQRKNSAFLAELATYANKPFATMRDAYLGMAQMGYVYYDDYEENIYFSRKGLHYVNSFNKRKDYDVLLIPSIYNSSVRDNIGNATIDLKDKYLTIRGVNRFRLSDSLQAYLRPGDGIIKINKNRDFGFSGELIMKNFKFKGKNFYFRYNEYLIELNKIDSITFIPQKLLAQGKMKEIGGDIRYPNSGKIYLSRADNKSAKISSPEYPRLVIPEGVTVYFDQEERGKTAYHRKVYFKIPVIDYDSLNTNDIDFLGTFYSDGIVPNFQERLITMPDHTLGFRHKVPTGSYKVYSSPSQVSFKSELVMDKTGLHTEGDIQHLTTTLQSKDILFMPDSVTATGLVGEIREAAAAGKAYFPQVNIKNYTLKWKPKADSMTIATKGGSFDFFTNTTRLEGQLLVRTTGLFGMGKMKRSDSETLSDRFKFNKESFFAENAELRVGSNFQAFKPSFYAREINMTFNVVQGKANIEIPKTATDSARFEFPYTAYRTNIQKAEWDNRTKRIGMKGNVASTVFTSTEAKQEGLRFNASQAEYDIEKQLLNVQGVPFIVAADAKIIPDRGWVSIRRDAEMIPFTKARVVLDTVSEYHRLANGNIQILSRNRFEGDATYRYVNLLGDTTNIKMGNFDLIEEKTSADAKALADAKKTKTPTQYRYHTQAKATLTDLDKFRISPRMKYRGDITMVSYQQALQLDGEILLDLKKRPDLENWIPYKGLSSKSVDIQVTPGMKANNVPLFAGLHFRAGASGLYTTFLSPKEDDKDEEIFVATGDLIDIPQKQQFEIIGKDRASGKIYEGSRYNFDDKTGIVNLEGKFDFLQQSQAQYLLAGGTATVRLDSAKYTFNQLLSFNFQLPPQAITQMADKIVRTNLDERNTDKAAEEDIEKLSLKMAQVVGDKAVTMYRDRTARGEAVPLHLVATKFNTLMVLSNVNMRWSDDQSCFYSVGKLGVANIGTTDINAQMEGYVEIRKTPEGDELYAYLEASPEVWYYFGLKDNQLGVAASEAEFNALIGAKAVKAKAKEFSFLPVDLDEKQLFVERFRELFVPKKKIEKKPVANKKEDPKKKAEKKKEEEKEGF